jgi:hypothetical protein
MRVLADGTFPTGKRLVPELLDACPVNTIQAFFRKSWRYMDAYRFVFTHYFYSNLSCLASILFASKGLDAKQAEFAVKKYRSHRRVGPAVMMSLGIMDNPE